MAATRRIIAEDLGDEQVPHGLQQWLRPSADIVENTPPRGVQITVEAEVHPAPTTSPEALSPSDLDTIDIALGIAKDTASVKADIRRVEELITANRKSHTNEHDALVELLCSIQDNMDKIDHKAVTLDAKLCHLTNKVNSQEKDLNKAQQDIEALFSAVTKLQAEPTPPSVETSHQMDVEENSVHVPRTENSLIISNLPNRDRDEEDICALLYVGLCLDIEDFEIKKINRIKSNNESPGNLEVEFGNLKQKINILKKKRQLRYTNEYEHVYIRAFKSNQDIIMERNFSVILRNMPRLNDLMMASNGKIIRRNYNSINNKLD